MRDVEIDGTALENYDCLSFENGTLSKEGEVYKLVGEAEDYEKDQITPFAIHFTDAEVSILTFRGDIPLLEETPWLALQTMTTDILDKYFLPGDYFNEGEKELLPLIAEISKLTYWALIPEEFKNTGFPLLKSYIQKYEFDNLLTLIEKVEKVYDDEGKKFPVIDKFISTVNKKKYEPLWRELYAKIADSQTGYPSKIETYVNTTKLEETRRNIKDLLESHGYSGTYPDFVKEGSVPGVHVEESYDMSYFVGSAKKAIFHIHCSENYFNEHLAIEFLCGTELLRKGETPGDIYSCLFNDGGHHLLHQVSYESDYINENGEFESCDLNQRVHIAVKKTELKKLTKEEKQEIGYLDVSGLKIFLSVFILMGGMYGILMTVAFMLIGIITCLLVGQPGTIPELFTDMPWWIILLVAWLGFGGAMGVVTVLAKKNKLCLGEIFPLHSLLFFLISNFYPINANCTSFVMTSV